MMTYNNNSISVEGEKLIFNGKAVTVRENKTYTYKLTSKGISAQGKAEGLYKFISECINENFGLVWVDAIMEHLQKIAA